MMATTKVKAEKAAPKKKAKTRKEMCATPTVVARITGEAAEMALDSILITETIDAEGVELQEPAEVPTLPTGPVVIVGTDGKNAASMLDALNANDSALIVPAGAKIEFVGPSDLPTIRRSEHFRSSVNVIDQLHGDSFSIYNADTCEAIKALPDECVDLSIYSPPFASLYTYSASDRDLGNCRTHDDFHSHLEFLMPEMLRVTRTGREMCLHVMDLPTSKTRDGYIGLTDFPGRIIRAAEEAGWIYHSRVVIWKDPVTAVQRTKAIGLLHKQLMKDSTMSRMGIPDYVITFRKPGDNAIAVTHVDDDIAILPPFGHDEKWKSVEQWQKWASPVWFDIDPNDTLQYRSAREDADERHVCPLQLEVIRRCMTLWSNPGEVVLSPFAGIGSEGVVSVENGRKFIGFELKRSYYEQAAKNLAAAEPKARGAQTRMF